MVYQNMLFYYEAENSPKPSGVVCLEGCYCERLITAGQNKAKDMPEGQVRRLFVLTGRKSPRSEGRGRGGGRGGICGGSG